MNRIIHLLTSVVLAAAVGHNACYGADAPAAPKPPTPVQVGDYGRPSALVIAGNQTFTREQILSGMRNHLDYHIAAHPAAPLTDYTAELERNITLGYQHTGFPSVTVKAVVDTNQSRVVVQVNEGPRFRCGEILLSGVKTMTNEVVRQKIADAIGGLEIATGSRSNLESILWVANHPAPLDEFIRESLTKRVQEALAALNYYQPTVSVRIVPDPARKLVDLKIEIADEGIKGTVAEIEVSGLYTNTRPQLLDYLKLKPGMEVNATLVAATSNLLWRSARFFRHDVSLVPLPPTGQFKLAIDLDEVREAPPLTGEFSPKESALLKIRDWLASWETRPEDFVLSVQFTNSSRSLNAELVLSPSGFALAARDSSSNSPPKLQYAIVASEKLIGLYSVWRQSKFTILRAKEGGGILIQIRPPSPKSYGRGNLTFAMAFGTEPTQPLRLELDLHPAVFLSMAHWTDSSLKDGVLTVTQTSAEVLQELRFDAATGRLLQAVASETGSNTGVHRLRSEEGALARLYKEIADVTADLPNRYVTNRGLGSWASFMAADLLHPPLLERALDLLDEGAIPKDPNTNSAVMPWQHTALALAREILGQRNLDGLFDPLNRIFGSKTDDEDEEHFVVPMDEAPANARANPMAPICAVVLNTADTLVPRDSWPWVLLRESAFTVAGQGKYTQAELDKLLKSDDMGPVGCLTAAYLLGRSDPKLARKFAERGLTRLNLVEFRKDYGLLLRTNSVVGDLVGNALGLLDGVNEAKLRPLLSDLTPDEAKFILHLSSLLANARGQPFGNAAWPVFEEHWDKIPRRYLEIGLNHYLPQVRFLTNTQALYDRGRRLLAPDGALQDFDEAAQCMRKAADQGHGGAQLSYGHLCESGEGVPKNLIEAMRWYRKAAEQKTPHAMCSIAMMYHYGKGVPQDVDEAARWYLLEIEPQTENDCAVSHYNLGRIYEEKNLIDEAVRSHRRAAEAGWPPAQAKLGDLLSDGLSTKPDYVEACQWLSLAATAGDKVSEIRLRRVKTKLTAEQLDEVSKRVTTITQRLEENAKKRSSRD